MTVGGVIFRARAAASASAARRRAAASPVRTTASASRGMALSLGRRDADETQRAPHGSFRRARGRAEDWR